ncbi:PREDICTED: nucleoside diphosphate-linked moiety X motif 22-like [Priapulus caudatus]|uniref:Nucleoside diphosphate-linked moiety X motif 22-like n=1 Tax=Priapulus caudatus TaxID=37621 RepID=A0ABM1E0A4_PRICU|nr:PREDICTED: nucleoside diphosphate-linked moiety X motif 22-like [Priapulus caudatus]
MAEIQDVSVVMAFLKTGPLSPSQVSVAVSSKFNRHSKPELDAKIDDAWKEKSASSAKLFNASKFRLSTAQKIAPIDSDPSCLYLGLGVTCYRDFIGTNMSADGILLQTDGLVDHADSQAYLADPLGVGAFIVTSDNLVVLIQRSKQQAEAPGMWDVPGGHPEPQDVLKVSSPAEVTCEALESKANSVVNEIFSSIMREVSDEVGIAEACLSEPGLMGIIRDSSNCGKPLAEFIIRCRLNGDEVIEAYRKGEQVEVEESTDIRLVPVDELPSLWMTEPGFWKQLTPQGKGCIQLYLTICDRMEKNIYFVDT